ncbi:MAG: Rrf2 family transcriptional regulator [Deltaproteobacteria bacterium]|nr:Rrf2 family transcriptional regulator [Deltaproteobacteria bacterium]
MNLSTRGRYATRAMLELALHHGKAPLSAAAISRAQGISARYLQQLLALLKRAGLVRVVMGRNGGFALTGRPDTVRVSEILDAVEGRLALVECVDHAERCSRAADCLSRAIWADATELLNRHFSSLTLADVLARCGKKAGDGGRGKKKPPMDADGHR